MSQTSLSHSTDEDAFSCAPQRALGDLGADLWIDSRDLRGGDLRSLKIEHASRRPKRI